MSLPIKAIIFDMDGTIVSSENAWQNAFKDLLKRYGFTALTQSQKKVLVDTIGLHVNDQWREIKLHLNIDQEIDVLIKEHTEIVFAQLTSSIKFVEGFQDFHKALKARRIPTAVATNATPEALKHISTIMRLDTFFGAHRYTIADVGNKPKPDPQIFTHASKQLNHIAEQCVVFEDSRAGFIAAQAAGMRCIAIKNEFNKEHIHLADAVIENYHEAFDALEKIGVLE